VEGGKLDTWLDEISSYNDYFQQGKQSIPWHNEMSEYFYKG